MPDHTAPAYRDLLRVARLLPGGQVGKELDDRLMSALRKSDWYMQCLGAPGSLDQHGCATMEAKAPVSVAMGRSFAEQLTLANYTRWRSRLLSFS